MIYIHLKKSIKILFILLLTIFIVGCAKNVAVREKIIESNQIPVSFDSYTIIFISDLHINSLIKEDYFLKVSKIINEISPDLILLGGDYVDSNTENIDKAFLLLENIAQTNTIAVLGNHDNWISNEKIKNKLHGINISTLENSFVRLKKNSNEIVISGLADDFSDSIDIDRALSGVRKDEFCILLSHTPEPYMKIKDEQRVDIMLSGHTHGGQVTFFGLWAPILPLRNKTYWRGTYSSKINQLLITNGIGVYRYPIRIFARPTIEKIILKRTI